MVKTATKMRLAKVAIIFIYSTRLMHNSACNTGKTTTLFSAIFNLRFCKFEC